MGLRSVGDIDWDALRDGPCHPSPDAWEDQALYFLLVDRFSDGREAGYRDIAGGVVAGGDTPPFRRGRDEESAVRTPEDARRWRRAGAGWCGGTLRGLVTKLGYLKRLGVTALWVSPVLKQAPWAGGNYHGYGTQDFLRVDPRFGTADDLRALTAEAHRLGMYVVLDILLNHAGDAFAYAEPDPENPALPPPFRGEPEPPYPVAGWRDARGEPTLPFEAGATDDPDAAVWPRELQDPACFSRRGRIVNWDDYPDYDRGDFFAFKDFELGCCSSEGDVGEAEGEEDAFRPSPALRALTDVYKYWMAHADVDGYRIDTVKHMPLGAVRWFAREVRAFAESVGKRNFLLVGEIVGDRARMAGTLVHTGLNAALGIGELSGAIRAVARAEAGVAAAAAAAADPGVADPARDYFDRFVNSRREGEADPDPVWWRDRVVTVVDDHDMVGRPPRRFAAEFADPDAAARGVLRAVALQALTLGIPCLYYGTEQGFDGHAPAPGDEPAPEGAPSPDDQTVRECLFGGPFGPFRSAGRHAFDEDGWLYGRVAALLALRAAHPALRRGRQYPRPLLDADGSEAAPSGAAGAVVAWSRLLDVDEFVCAIRGEDDGGEVAAAAERTVLVTVDASRHGDGGRALTCVYSADPSQVGREVCPVRTDDGGWAVPLSLPPGGVVVYR